MTSIPERRAIIRRGGRGVAFSPLLDSIANAVMSRRIRWDARASTVAVPVSALHQSAPEESCIRVGFEAVVRRCFENAGYQVFDSAGGIVPRDLGQPEHSCVRLDDEPLTRTFLDFLRENREGLVRFLDGRLDIPKLIAEAALAYPSARIVVVTDCRALGRRIARRLGRWLGRVPAFDSRPRAELLEEELPRIAVATFFALADLDVEWGIDLLFLPNILELIGGRPDLAVSRAHHARVFGFAPLAKRLSPLEEIYVRSVLGFAELLVPGHGMKARPLEVVWSSIGGHAAAGAPTIVETLRRFVWQDPVRIRRVSALARLLERGDRPNLSQRFPNVAGALPASLNGYRTLILCDNAEHAAQIGRAVPNAWFVLGDDETVLPRDLITRTRRDPRTLSQLQLVATRDALADGGIDLDGIDVIIVAGANLRAVHIPIELLSSTASDPRPVRIVEFRDRRHLLLRQWTRSRIDEYARRDVVAPGGNLLLHRVDRFIQSGR